jgi:hypothetical protein
MLGNPLDERRNRHLATRADVHGLIVVVPFRGQQDGLDRIVDVQEIAGRRTVAPHINAVPPGLDRLGALANQRRDDVRGTRIEIVTGPV